VRKKRVFKRKVIVSETRSDVMVESGIMRSAAFLAAFLAACFFITGTNASPTDQVPPSPTHQKLQNDTSAKIQNDTSAKLSELPSADLQAADPTEEREAYISGVNTIWCKINPNFCGPCHKIPWSPFCTNRRDSEAVRAEDSLPASSSSSRDIQGPKLRMSYGEEKGERADASDDVMAIKRQKGVVGTVTKLICKLFPKFLPCKLFGKLGRNRLDMADEPVNADGSYPSPSNGIEGPDSEMGNAESDVPPSPY